MTQRLAARDNDVAPWSDCIPTTGQAANTATIETIGTSVCIALSTHDGRSFLAAQLESIVAQSHARWTILWRDDGSADDTPAMMRAFAAAEGQGRTTEIDDKPGRLGITGSFMALVGRVPPGGVLAFAD